MYATSADAADVENWGASHASAYRPFFPVPYNSTFCCDPMAVQTRGYTELAKMNAEDYQECYRRAYLSGSGTSHSGYPIACLKNTSIRNLPAHATLAPQAADIICRIEDEEILVGVLAQLVLGMGMTSSVFTHYETWIVNIL